MKYNYVKKYLLKSYLIFLTTDFKNVQVSLISNSQKWVTYGETLTWYVSFKARPPNYLKTATPSPLIDFCNYLRTTRKATYNLCTISRKLMRIKIFLNAVGFTVKIINFPSRCSKIINWSDKLLYVCFNPYLKRKQLQISTPI